jgi:hypothetical protein
MSKKAKYGTTLRRGATGIEKCGLAWQGDADPAVRGALKLPVEKGAKFQS